MSVTLGPWWLLVYIGIGVVLWLPLEWVAHRRLSRPDPFWPALMRAVRRRPYVPVATIVLWPTVLLWSLCDFPWTRRPEERGGVMDDWNPGSDEARAAGCICPTLGNNFGRRTPNPPDGWWLDPGCPLHGPGPTRIVDR